MTPAPGGCSRPCARLSTQLSGAQVGITVTNLAIGFLAEPAIASLIDGPLEALGDAPGRGRGPVAVGVGLVLGTILTMIFGELVPKNLALAKPMEVARATQRFQRAFTAVNRIPIRILNGSANAFVRRLGIEPQEELRSARSSTELASLIQRSADQGTLDADTAELMERSVEFGVPDRRRDHDAAGAHRQPRGQRPRERRDRAGASDRSLALPGPRRRGERGRAPCTSSTSWRCRSTSAPRPRSST